MADKKRRKMNRSSVLHLFLHWIPLLGRAVPLERPFFTGRDLIKLDRDGSEGKME